MEIVDYDVGLAVDEAAAKKIAKMIDDFNHEAMEHAAQKNPLLQKALEANKDRRGAIVMMTFSTTRPQGVFSVFRKERTRWSVLFNEEWTLEYDYPGSLFSNVDVMRFRAGGFTFHARTTKPEKAQKELNNSIVTVKKGLLSVQIVTPNETS